jgi:hypothetical protein
VGVALLAVALTIASINSTRADGGKDKETPRTIIPAAGVSVERDSRTTEPPAPSTPPPLSSTPVPPATSAPSTPPPAYPAAPAGFAPAAGPGDTATGMISVQEVLQLKALKRRIGGENVKRLVDALGD